MSDESLPWLFWISAMAIVGGIVWFWRKRNAAYGIPAVAVLLTCAIWYLGDALYNDYEVYKIYFFPETLERAWWQVLLFILTFCLIVSPVFSKLNSGLLHYGSNIQKLAGENRIDRPEFQKALTEFNRVLVSIWVLLMMIALIRVNFDIKGLFFPWLGYKHEPWARARIGGGFDALFSLAQYLQIFLTASIGVIAALTNRPKTRFVALFICFLALPYFLFDHARSMMLAVTVPGVLAWVFLRIKKRVAVKAILLLAMFFVTEAWFEVVMDKRQGRDVEALYNWYEYNKVNKNTHLGLNMFQELAWINQFIEEDRFQPNWGARYFAEIVNPIPRVLWAGKPTIGIGYAILRGQEGGSEANAGVFASISTGMIGQGVVNFGRVMGPMTTAFLMALWVALLGRQDLLSSKEPSRLLLYALGLILTFNMGRDITLLVLYPFFFGLLLLVGWKRFFISKNKQLVDGDRTTRPV